MTQGRINKAYPSLMALCEFRLPIKKARELYLLFTKVKAHFEFALIEERKSIAEFDGIENPDGTIDFGSRESLEAYKNRIEELNSSEVDPDWSVVVLTDNDIGVQSISPSDIMRLDGFVIFE